MLSRGLMFLAVCGLGFGCADGIPAEIPEPETQTFAEPEAAPLDPPEGDWWWWRGPTRNGKAAAGQTIPTSWSRTDNVVWKVNVRRSWPLIAHGCRFARRDGHRR